MITFALGIIVGLVCAIIFIIIALKEKPYIERKFRQVESRLKQKGAILEPENEELNDWVKTLSHE